MIRAFFIFFILASSMDGCDPVPLFPAGTVEGYRPVYEGSEEATIKVIAPIPMVNRGKIYVYGNYLLIGEKFKGVHIIDNSNPVLPIKKGFIQIMGNEDIAIKDNVMYADYLGKVVSIDFTNLNSVQVKSKLDLNQLDIYSNTPPFEGFYFECPEASKGQVVGWVKQRIVDPKCGTPYAGNN